MKQKYQYLILLLLALALMLLASCRTKTQCIQTASLDSLSLHQKDSISTKLDFSFDRMILTTLDYLLEDSSSSTVTPSRPNGRAGHGVRGSSLIIKNGKLSSSSEKLTTTDADTKSAQSATKQVRIRSAPQYHPLLLILICIFIFFLLAKTLISKRSSQ